MTKTKNYIVGVLPSLAHGLEWASEVEGAIDEAAAEEELDSALLSVKEDITNEPPADYKSDYADESCTWTTFTFTTSKGEVVVRWHGSSNGYYSESVSFAETT